MTPATLITYIAEPYATFAEGWNSYGPWEMSAQIALDTIFKNHLSSKIMLDSDDDRMQVDDDDYVGIPTTDWGKFRENKYPIKFPAKTGPQKGVKDVDNFADFIFKNKRYIDDGNAFRIKSTKYYIEMKVETRDENKKSGKFAGKTWFQAYEADKEKLLAARDYEGKSAKPRRRRRYWMVMLSCSEDNITDMYKEKWTAKKIIQGNPNLLICIDQWTS